MGITWGQQGKGKSGSPVQRQRAMRANEGRGEKRGADAQRGAVGAHLWGAAHAVAGGASAIGNERSRRRRGRPTRTERSMLAEKVASRHDTMRRGERHAHTTAASTLRRVRGISEGRAHASPPLSAHLRCTVNAPSLAPERSE